MRDKGCFHNFIKYSSLNVLGMLGLSCYILADTFFIANALGSRGLTALNLAIPIYSFVHGCGLMIGMGGGIRFAIRKCQGERRESDVIFSHAVGLAVGLAVCFLLAGLLLSGRIVALLGADRSIFDMTRIYVRMVLLFSPLFLLNNVLLAFVRNDGAPQRSMAAMVGGSLSNVVLDYVFLFPCRMGMFGAVLATGLAPVVSMLILSPHMLRRRNSFHLVRCRWSRTVTAGILSGGVPSLITEVSAGVVILVFNGILLAMQGNVGVAAYGVIANLSLVVTAIYTGIGQGIQPILSSSFGAGNREDVRRLLRYALTAMLLLSAVLYGVVWCGASPIAAAFNSEGDRLLQAFAEEGLKLYFIACPFAGFNIILAVYFAATEYAHPARVISLLRGFVLILPMAFALSAGFGMTGVWCAVPVTEALVAGVGVLYWRRGDRQMLVRT